MAIGFGILELIFVLGGGGLLGTPPGDRDPALLKCAPTNCIAYFEWAERGVGQAGAPGIDGLIAEPEVREFAKRLELALTQYIESSSSSAGELEKSVASALPRTIAKIIHHSGCFYAWHDAGAKPTAQEAAKPRIAVPPGLRFVLIVNAGNEAEDVAGKLQQIVEHFPIEIRKEKLDHQPFPNLPDGLSLTLHRHEKYFILGFGDGSIESALSGLKRETKGLASDERFTTAIKRVEMNRTAGIGWIDVKRLIEVVAHAAAPQGLDLSSMAASLGLDKLDSIASTTGIVDGQIRTRTFVATGGSTRGVLVLAAGRGMKAADFEQIPADADFVAAVSIDPPRLLETAQQLALVGGEKSRQQFDRAIKDFEVQIDATFEGQIFTGFGNVLVLHDSPSEGGVLVTGLVGSIEVLDKNKAYHAFTGALDALQDLLNGGAAGSSRTATSLKKELFMDETIWFVNVVGESDFIFAPSFCMTESRLLMAAQPQALKAHLRFLKSKQPTFATKLGKEIPLNEGELFFVSYADTKSLMRYLYSILPYAGQAILSEMQEEGFNLDIFAVPSAPSIMPYLQNAFSTAVRTREGLLFESQSPLPIPGASSLLPITVPMIGASVLPLGQIDPPVDIPVPPKAVIDVN